MGTLSNLAWLRDFWPREDGSQLVFRPASGHELEPALRLLLAGSDHPVDDAHLREFVRLAHEQNAMGGVWVAALRGQLVTVAFPLLSPGRTLLLFVPHHCPAAPQEEALPRLIQTLCTQAAARGAHLAQVLVDTHDEACRAVLASCGFHPLAELLYMQASIPADSREPALASSQRWVTYSPQSHALFQEAVLRTYRQSLDCPGLNGLREIDDILAGHRATGEFDPQMWRVLCEGEDPAAVLLLARLPRASMVEVVYLGVAPDYRKRGLGELLMSAAAASVAACGYRCLSLAVDSLNLPALRLYWRHGFQMAGRKSALLRDLRRPHP